MKKEAAKTILSSAVSIALSAALIAGSTFALFTGQSNTDISITSGNVDVKATASISRVYSAEWNESDKKYGEHTMGENVHEGETCSFSNGGTVTYSGGTVTIKSISPGDGVDLEIKVENKSSISIKYQTVVTFVSGGSADLAVSAEDEAALYKALNITVGDMENISSNRLTAVSGWSGTVNPGDDPIGPIKVNIELPWDTDDTLQAMQCEMLIGVYAVQSNGFDDTNKEVYFVNSHSNLSEVLENMEDGGIIAAGEEMTISDETPLAVPENKKVILDVNGNAVNVNKETGKSDSSQKDSLVVPEGSTLTVTNSAEGGSLNLNANADAENWSSGPNGTYTLKVEEGGTLNFEDVHCNFQNVEAAGGNHIVYVGGGTVNCNAGTEIDFTGSAFADGFLVREGGTMNVTDTKFHSTGAVGQITVGHVSPLEKESTLNINDGTVIEYSDANSFAGAIVVNQTGKVNIHEGSLIKVCGGISAYSGAAAIRVVGGGNVVMDGGTISLETTTQNGWAYAVMVLNNIFADPEVGGGKVAVGLAVDAHIEFKGNAKILANEHSIIFATQRNHEKRYKTGADGMPDADSGYQEPKITIDDAGNLVPTIIIREGVTIMAHGTVVNKENNEFSQGKPAPEECDAYTPDAIKDERVFD